jgi:flagellar M-ring protein FliF
VMVPKDDVYKTRITLSGEGLPSGADGGYSLLDKQDLSTSQFKEQTDFKRAMEGELAKTIEAMNGVQSAVVHLALPEKQVFADKQDPPTASVLVSSRPGTTLTSEQVQSVVHLVAASIDGMDPEKVTVADSTGKLLSASGTDGTAMASSRDQAVQRTQQEMIAKIQSVLDRVVGPGNSTVQVTADLNFDKATIQSETFKQADPQGLALSTSKSSEKYKGGAAGSGSTGVVGPDGGMDPGTAGTTGTGSGSSYDKRAETTDNAVDRTVEKRETAPGGINSLHVAVALDRTAAANNNPQEIQQLISSAVGINTARGDTIRLSTLPFDRTAEKTAASEIKAEDAQAAKADRMTMYRNIALGALVLFALVLAWLRGRKKAKQRAEATNYVIEQLRTEKSREPQVALENPATALLSLEGNVSPEDEVRRELADLVERQPDDVAALLRGWLVER